MDWTVQGVRASIPFPVFRTGILTAADAGKAPGKRSSEITKILFATDFSPESSAAAPYAVSLAQECQAYLTLLHVIKAPKAGDLVRAGDLMKSSTQLLHNLLPAEAELWCVPEYVVEQGDPAEKILGSCRANWGGADCARCPNRAASRAR